MRSCGWLILKFSNDRSVCAPQYLSAGTCTSPKASVSARVAAILYVVAWKFRWKRDCEVVREAVDVEDKADRLVFIERQLAGAELEGKDFEVVNEGFDDNLKEAPALGLAADAARTELVPRADRSIMTLIWLQKVSQSVKNCQLKTWQMRKYVLGELIDGDCAASILYNGMWFGREIQHKKKVTSSGSTGDCLGATGEWRAGISRRGIFRCFEPPTSSIFRAHIDNIKKGTRTCIVTIVDSGEDD